MRAREARSADVQAQIPATVLFSRCARKNTVIDVQGDYIPIYIKAITDRVQQAGCRDGALMQHKIGRGTLSR